MVKPKQMLCKKKCGEDTYECSPAPAPKKKRAARKKKASSDEPPVEHRKGTLTNMAARIEQGKTEYARDKGVSIARASFARVVRSTLSERECDIKRISPKAILALQRFAEQSVGDHINRAAHIAEAIGNSKTLMVKHLEAAENAFHVSGGAKLDALEH